MRRNLKGLRLLFCPSARTSINRTDFLQVGSCFQACVPGLSHSALTVLCNIMIITTNLEFSQWPQVFGHEQSTMALLDRLTRHALILAMNGENFRFRENLNKVRPEWSRGSPTTPFPAGNGRRRAPTLDDRGRLYYKFCHTGHFRDLGSFARCFSGPPAL